MSWAYVHLKTNTNCTLLCLSYNCKFKLKLNNGYKVFIIIFQLHVVILRLMKLFFINKLNTYFAVYAYFNLPSTL